MEKKFSFVLALAHTLLHSTRLLIRSVSLFCLPSCCIFSILLGSTTEMELVFELASFILAHRLQQYICDKSKRIA